MAESKEYLTDASDLYNAVAARDAARHMERNGNGHLGPETVQVFVGEGLPVVEAGANETVFGSRDVLYTPTALKKLRDPFVDTKFNRQRYPGY